ncbi:MAG: MBL fold metallo-hydrolase [Actinomycetales bacterium]|nr:MBL fold metallo-hydrolase [Actinomycetales bacterium]
MRLTVLGCAGSFPTADSPASAYLVEHEGHRILLDLGNGAISGLQRLVDLDDPDALDAVVLSHGHLDHCADLGSLYVARTYHPTVRFPRLPVLGPAGIAGRIAEMYGTSIAALESSFAFGELGSSPMALGPFEVDACPARHPVAALCIGVRAGGRRLAYSGDTGPNDELVELARDADLALFEASFVGDDAPPALHLTATQAGQHAALAGARSLLVTHLVRWNDDAQVLAEATAAFGGPTRLAHPGLVVDV